MTGRRALAWGGAVGPLAFAGAWIIGSATTEQYSPIDDAISRLAAVEAPTRALMSAGFVMFGVGVPLFGLALRDALAGRAWMSAVATGLATLGVAAFPLDVSPTIDDVHAVWASAGYVTLALTPWLAAPSLATAGHRGAARWSRAVAVVSGLSLLATLAGPAHGLFQRAGVTVVDVWIVTAAVALLARRSARGGTGRTMTSSDQ